jgi:hypothetical protein
MTWSPLLLATQLSTKTNVRFDAAALSKRGLACHTPLRRQVNPVAVLSCLSSERRATAVPIAPTLGRAESLLVVQRPGNIVSTPGQAQRRHCAA